jgi:hypothetical protein
MTQNMDRDFYKARFAGTIASAIKYGRKAHKGSEMDFQAYLAKRRVEDEARRPGGVVEKQARRFTKDPDPRDVARGIRRL